MSLALLLGVLFLLSVVSFKGFIYLVWISSLSKVPNAHWSLAVSPFWILQVRRKGIENHVLLDRHRRLGSIVRVAPDEVSISSTDDVRTVYSGDFEKEAWLARSFDNYRCVRSAPEAILRRRQLLTAQVAPQTCSPWILKRPMLIGNGCYGQHTVGLRCIARKLYKRSQKRLQ